MAFGPSWEDQFMASPSIKKQLQRKGRSKLEKLEYLLPVDQAYENHIRHTLPWVSLPFWDKGSCRIWFLCNDTGAPPLCQVLSTRSFLFEHHCRRLCVGKDGCPTLFSLGLEALWLQELSLKEEQSEWAHLCPELSCGR